MTALRTNFNAGENFTHDDANRVGINVNGATLTGTFSAMPTAGQPSRLYYCTDTDAVYRDDGSTWNRIRFGLNGTTQPLPPTSGWSTNTMGTSSVTADKDGYLLEAVGAGTGAEALRFHYRTYPATPFTATFYFDFNIRLHDSSSAGGIFISNGTRFVGFQAAQDKIYVSEYSNSTSFNANEFSNTNLLAAYGLPHWMRFSDDGTNREYLLSSNGIDWISVYTSSRTTWLTPSQIGWAMNSRASSGSKSYGRLRSLSGV
jgi:hypothetical protein